MRRINHEKARLAWVNWDTNRVGMTRADVAGDSAEPMVAHEFIGPDCWKQIGLPA